MAVRCLSQIDLASREYIAAKAAVGYDRVAQDSEAATMCVDGQSSDTHVAW
jgi:hypothetical protein